MYRIPNLDPNKVLVLYSVTVNNKADFDAQEEVFGETTLCSIWAHSHISTQRWDE